MADNTLYVSGKLNNGYVSLKTEDTSGNSYAPYYDSDYLYIPITVTNSFNGAVYYQAIHKNILINALRSWGAIS